MVTEEQKRICDTSPSSLGDSDINKNFPTAEVSSSNDDDVTTSNLKAEAADMYISKFFSSKNKKSITVWHLLSGGDSGRNCVSNQKEKHEWFAFSADNNPQKAPLSLLSGKEMTKKQHDGATSSLDQIYTRSQAKSKCSKFRTRKKHRLVMLKKDNLKGIVETHLMCGPFSVEDTDEKIFMFADLL
eukprot:11953282-Ditylum_brightwellii.AAC.1